jgi:hypothetical protein
MWKYIAVFFLGVLCASLVALAVVQHGNDQELHPTPRLTPGQYATQSTLWLDQNLRRIIQIKPGMTRRDLMKQFESQGGISNRVQETFVYSECQLIQVDVRFYAARYPIVSQERDPDDIIATISQPYLNWPRST